MATKGASTGTKRKSAPAAKGKDDSKSKKVRLDKTKAPKPVVEESDASEDFSDAEEGGAMLEEEEPRKKAKGPGGKVFERGKPTRMSQATPSAMANNSQPRRLARHT
jgi:pumilio homology domain family member 6